MSSPVETTARQAHDANRRGDFARARSTREWAIRAYGRAAYDAAERKVAAEFHETKQEDFYLYNRKRP